MWTPSRLNKTLVSNGIGRESRVALLRKTSNIRPVKLSLKVEYSCRVLAQLGRYFGSKQLLHIDDLAQSEAIPSNYLVQILNELRNGGLITSRRGKQGGYALARPPKDITIHEVIRVVDFDMLDNRLNGKGQSGALFAGVWTEISSVFIEKTKNYTLEDLMPDDASDMYYI